jgi:lactocepin
MTSGSANQGRQKRPWGACQGGSNTVTFGDRDGDGDNELGGTRPNGTGGLVFSRDLNGNRAFDPGADQVVNFGLANDRIVVGDWNAGGSDKLGVARPNLTGRLVYSLNSNCNRAFDPGVDSVFNFGLASDRIVTGSWSAGTQGTSFVTGFGSPGVRGQHCDMG